MKELLGEKAGQISYTDESAEVILEYLDEIITNHAMTNDDASKDTKEDNPWVKEGHTVLKTLSAG